MGINEALDNLYVCATNAKSETLEEGYYEKCYDRVIEELNQKDKAEADLYEANNRIADLLLILEDKDRMIDEMAKEILLKYQLHYKTVDDIKKIYEERCEDAKN